MKRCIYSIYVPLKNYRHKFAPFERYYSRIIESHKAYANSINVDYELFEKIPPALFHSPTYDQINFGKYYYAEKLCQKYDEILYIDFDVIPNTTENFFEVFNVSEYIPVKATIPYNPKIASEYTELYEKTIAAVEHNKHSREIERRYHEGITSKSFHGKPWVAEKYPKEFEEKYNLDWWLKAHNIKELYVKEGYRIEDIEPWDDVVKYAAIDILTEGHGIFYNTGVMGFCSDTINQLNIFEDFVDWCKTIKNLRSEKWPKYITKHIDINNEVLFSHKMIANNVPVKDISRDWNYFVDWNSILIVGPLRLGPLYSPSHDEFDTCKFRHYLNKNFEKQWPM